jgi:lysozyme family protein
MAEFEAAIEVVLDHEGRVFECDPRDPGGATFCGITAELLKDLGGDGDVNGDGHIDAEDIRAIAAQGVGRAKEVWRDALWDHWRYGQISSQAVATKIMDMAVLLGWPAAHRAAQRALLDLDIPVAVDGMLGPRSLAAIELAVTKYQSGGEAYLNRLRVEFAATLGKILDRNPNMEWARAGWMERAEW